MAKMWQIELRHNGLNKYRFIRGSDKYVVEQKAVVQRAAWDEMWQRKLEKEHRTREKKQKTKDVQSKIESAKEQTKEAPKGIEELENVLKHTLNINDVIDWEALKDRTKFPKPKPQQPQLLSISRPPKETDSRYQPKLGLLDKILSSKKQIKINSAKLLFKNDYDNWMKQKEETLKRNAELERQYQNELKQWETEEQEFLRKPPSGLSSSPC